MPDKASPAKGIIRSLGLVFGDIGTSPIYTLTVIFLLTKPTGDNVVGVLSLIDWTLIILVTVIQAPVQPTPRCGNAGDDVAENFRSFTEEGR